MFLRFFSRKHRKKKRIKNLYFMSKEKKENSLDTSNKVENFQKNQTVLGVDSVSYLAQIKESSTFDVENVEKDPNALSKVIKKIINNINVTSISNVFDKNFKININFNNNNNNNLNNNDTTNNTNNKEQEQEKRIKTTSNTSLETYNEKMIILNQELQKQNIEIESLSQIEINFNFLSNECIFDNQIFFIIVKKALQDLIYQNFLSSYSKEKLILKDIRLYQNQTSQTTYQKNKINLFDKEKKEKKETLKINGACFDIYTQTNKRFICLKIYDKTIESCLDSMNKIVCLEKESLNLFEAFLLSIQSLFFS